MIENDYIENDYYISFDAVWRAIDEYADYVIDDETGEWYIPISKALSLIEDITPADVRPVVRGKWLEPDDDYGYLVCSVCEERSPNDERWHFCPNCGADMREVNND